MSYGLHWKRVVFGLCLFTFVSCSSIWGEDKRMTQDSDIKEILGALAVEEDENVAQELKGKIFERGRSAIPALWIESQQGGATSVPAKYLFPARNEMHCLDWLISPRMGQRLQWSSHLRTETLTSVLLQCKN